MHKSQLFTFGFLLSSLVMLVLVPLLNNNSFLSNPAMAQEYDKYRDSSYSQYPTDDNKYQCRTGPFEGFFVGSVEFCKFNKFDDKDDRKDGDRDNRTGTQGPQGPQGPAGPAGIVNAELCPPNTDLENVYVLNGTTAESCNFETPEPPQNGSLTVNKEIFGCDNIDEDVEVGGFFMNCKELSNNSPLWINCEDAPISMESFCQNLPENLFDIRVSDSQNNPIANDFVGSEDGRTFDNLQIGTYTVEEIKHETTINQLGESQGAEDLCKERGFADGGRLDNQNADTLYFICFEYEDEQGNDCNTITLVAGEQKICTVKNYIQSTDILR